ncbi:response regulator [Shewanella sp. YIC-542]|uniref:response regulator n=1 Tax=Shewanella mytili TaxID=3377111 RepID=UPI00398F508E
MALDVLNILLVEDDPVFRQLLAGFLRSRGALVTEADDGREGLAQFVKKRFDIILADVFMPNMDGLTMLRNIYQTGSSIPSIILSGNQRMALVTEALRLGASDYLVKPLDDLYAVEYAINQCLIATGASPSNVDSHIDELSYLELNENLALLEQNTEAAKCVQQQLFPGSAIDYPKIHVDYTLLTHNRVSPFFIDSAMIGAEHFIMYLAHFHPEDNRAAFAGVLLKSFVNQKVKDCNNQLDDTVTNPDVMLKYLNERLVSAGLDLHCDIIYGAVNLSTRMLQIAQAGRGLSCYLRHGQQLVALPLPESMRLGLYAWAQPSMQVQPLNGNNILCLSTSIAEHQVMLRANDFQGLLYAPHTPEGGFVQMQIN